MHLIITVGDIIAVLIILFCLTYLFYAYVTGIFKDWKRKKFK